MNKKRNLYRGNYLEGLTFRSWLRGKKRTYSAIGDLANDAFADRGWRGKSANSLHLRMLRMNACERALLALHNAAKEYGTWQ